MKNYFFDLLVVVVGISLSFLVEEYRVRRELNNHREQLIQRLATTLTDDIKDLNENIIAHQVASESAGFMIEYQQGQHRDVSLDSLSYHLSALLINTIFVPNEEEYESLKNSGQLELISDSALVKSIHRKYARHPFLRQVESYMADLIAREVYPKYAGRTRPINALDSNFLRIHGAYPVHSFTQVPYIENHVLTDLQIYHLHYANLSRSLMKKTQELQDRIYSRKG